MKLSIIVPCYNVSQYITDCVESIISNNLDDYEIILINDGSKDNTLEVINNIRDKYPKVVKVFNLKNQGVSMARNEGVEKAKGDYITFIDSDDSVNKRMYQSLLAKAYEKNFDMVVCDTLMIYPDHNKEVDSGVSKDCLNVNDVKKIMPAIYPSVWNKIYKKSIISDLRFKKGVWYEDVEYMYRLLLRVNSIGVVKEFNYNYMQREGSITYTYDKRLYDLIDNLNGLIKYYKDQNLLNEYYDEIEYVYVRYLYATFVKRLAKGKDKTEFDKGVSYVINEVEKNFPNYKKNKYLKGSNPKNIYLKYFNKLIAKVIFNKEKDKMN